MAAGDRTKRIRQRVLDRLGASGLGVVSTEKVHRTMDDVQREIAEELMCLEAKWEMVASAGEELVPFPPSFIAERKLIPRSGSQELVRVDFDKKDALTREYNALTAGNGTSNTDNTDLMYYYQWNDNFGFLLSNGQPPAADVEIDCYYWSTPDPTRDVLSSTKDPKIHRRFDRLIEYMTVSELTGRDEDEARWNREMERMRTRTNQVNIDVGEIPHTRDFD